MTRIEYILKHAPHVIRALTRTRLFPSIMIAQALLESADKYGTPGNSLLAAKFNNHFGIKADVSWVGQKVGLSTNEFVAGAMTKVKAWFRVYQHAFQSFDDRIQFLIANPRYKSGGVFKALDAGEQAMALQRSGYATDPGYASKLMKLIYKFNLEKLDHLTDSKLDLSDYLFQKPISQFNRPLNEQNDTNEQNNK
ncbi:MAG: glucosaminidase domain-containing protein [Chryseolinea sp.]